jgi:hypothetical protein
LGTAATFDAVDLNRLASQLFAVLVRGADATNMLLCLFMEFPLLTTNDTNTVSSFNTKRQHGCLTFKSEENRGVAGGFIEWNVTTMCETTVRCLTLFMLSCCMWGLLQCPTCGQDAATVSTPDQKTILAELVRLAWEPVDSDSCDIQMVREYYRKPMRPQDVIDGINDQIRNAAKRRPGKPPTRGERLRDNKELRDAQIDAILAAQGPKFINTRYRSRGGAERVDRGFADSWEAAFSAPFDHSSITGVSEAGLQRSVLYEWKYKRVSTHLQDRPMYAKENMWCIGTLEPEVLYGIRSATAVAPYDSPLAEWKMSDVKVAALVNGTNDELSMVLQNGTDFPTIRVSGASWFGDRTDLILQSCSPLQISETRTTSWQGKLGRTTKQSEFDPDNNVPRTWVRTTYDGEGEIETRMRVHVVSYARGVELEDDVFDFKPLDGFMVTQRIGRHVYSTGRDGTVLADYESPVFGGIGVPTANGVSPIWKVVILISNGVVVICLISAFLLRRRRRRTSNRREADQGEDVLSSE